MIALSLNKISNAFTNLMQFDSSLYYSKKLFHTLNIYKIRHT